MLDNLYNNTNILDGQTLFLYVTIFIFILWFFSNRTISLGIFLAIIISSFIISYLSQKKIKETNNIVNSEQIKEETIKPKVNDTEHHNEIIDFLFSIQDFYIYNPQQYGEMVHNINNFYDLYKLCMINNHTCFENHDRMKKYKRNAINALMSIIFQSPIDENFKNKINNSSKVLDDILTANMDEISYIIDNYIYKHGYDVDTKIIDYDTKPFNEYEDIFKSYSHEIV
jgi:hypothetical protein